MSDYEEDFDVEGSPYQNKSGPMKGSHLLNN